MTKQIVSRHLHPPLLINLRFTKPFVKASKNDAADSEGIAKPPRAQQCVLCQSNRTAVIGGPGSTDGGPPPWGHLLRNDGRALPPLPCLARPKRTADQRRISAHPYCRSPPRSCRRRRRWHSLR